MSSVWFTIMMTIMTIDYFDYDDPHHYDDDPVYFEYDDPDHGVFLMTTTILVLLWSSPS